MKTIPFKQLPSPRPPAPVPVEPSTRVPHVSGAMRCLSLGSWLISLSIMASKSTHVVAGVAVPFLRPDDVEVRLRKDCYGFDLLARKGSWSPEVGRLSTKVRSECVRKLLAACVSPRFGLQSPPFARLSSRPCALGLTATPRPVPKLGAFSSQSSVGFTDSALPFT